MLGADSVQFIPSVYFHSTKDFCTSLLTNFNNFPHALESTPVLIKYVFQVAFPLYQYLIGLIFSNMLSPQCFGLSL